jgi:predicted ATPase
VTRALWSSSAHVGVYREHSFTLVDIPPAKLSRRVAVVDQVISEA